MKHLKVYEQFLTFSKIKVESNKDAWGGGTTYTFYQMGDKVVIVRYNKVAGAPRMNSVAVFVVEEQLLIICSGTTGHGKGV